MSAITPTEADRQEAERRVRQRLADAELATVVAERAAREAEAERQRIIAAKALAEKQAAARGAATALVSELQRLESQVSALMEELAEVSNRFAALQREHREMTNLAHSVLQAAYGSEAMTVAGQIGLSERVLRLPPADPSDKPRNAARQALVFLIEHS